jgi:arylsulfatase
MEQGKDRFPGPTTTLQVELELYNLDKDISETKNVIDSFPDIVKRLKALANKAREELGDRLTGVVGKHVRPPG